MKPIDAITIYLVYEENELTRNPILAAFMEEDCAKEQVIHLELLHGQTNFRIMPVRMNTDHDYYILLDTVNERTNKRLFKTD